MDIKGSEAMKVWTKTIACLAVIGTFATPVFAQGGAEGTMFTNDTVLIVTPSGQIMRRQMVDAAMSEMMIKDATPMTAGTMIMMHGGKMYMVSDKKMPDGKMISEKMMMMK
jgi:hypothetical protein